MACSRVPMAIDPKNRHLLLEGLHTLIEEEPDAQRLLSPRLEEVLSLLSIYIEEIERFNPAYGLVRVKDSRELVVKHILDSLAPLGSLEQLLRRASPQGPWFLADLGSGAGLPGIPLGICLPQVQWTLLERMGRRGAFLRSTLAVLGLSHLVVEEGEMERAVPGRFTGLVFRAFKPLTGPVLQDLCRLLAPGGGTFLTAWKGRRQAVEAEMAGVEQAAALPPGLHWEIRPVRVPFLEEERHVLVIERGRTMPQAASA